MTKISRKKQNQRKKARGSNYREMRTRQFIMRQLVNKNGAVCAICGKEITDMKDCTIDHIIPISKGGMTTIENCQLAHFGCNQKKGSNSYGG